MKTIRFIAFLLAVGNILPALAQSGPTDKPFSYFVAATRNGVESLKGKYDGQGQWLATQDLPGASQTYVDRTDGEMSLLAFFRRETYSDARATFDGLVDLAKTDLGKL